MERLFKHELKEILRHAGSWKRFRELLGIDARQLQDVIRMNGLSLDRLSGMSDSEIRADLVRIGSTALFCMITGCKESELRRRAEAAGIDLKTVCAPIGSKIGIGRKGELFFKEKRGIKILEDCLETQGHSAPYDFMDVVYGRVNVKTANRSKLKAQTRAKDPYYWYFRLDGAETCDYFAFVPLDPAGVPKCSILVKGSDLNGRTQFKFTGKELLVSSRNIILIADGVYQWVGFIRLVNTIGPETTAACD